MLENWDNAETIYITIYIIANSRHFCFKYIAEINLSKIKAIPIFGTQIHENRSINAHGQYPLNSLFRMGPLQWLQFLKIALTTVPFLLTTMAQDSYCENLTGSYG